MKIKNFVISLLWGLLIILFPVISGVLSAIFSLSAVETLFLQGIFMCLGLLPPILMIVSRKWKMSELGLKRPNHYECNRTLYFLPLLLTFIPVAVRGFYIKSASYFLGCLFLYSVVGIAEEVYFRGIVPHFLSKSYSKVWVLILSTFIFSLGHSATAFAGNGLADTLLTIINAFLFGFMVMELSLLVESIIPGMVIHFLFNFETKFTIISGSELMIAELIRGTLMVIIAVWLGRMIIKSKTI